MITMPLWILLAIVAIYIGICIWQSWRYNKKLMQQQRVHDRTIQNIIKDVEKHRIYQIEAILPMLRAIPPERMAEDARELMASVIKRLEKEVERGPRD